MLKEKGIMFKYVGLISLVLLVGGFILLGMPGNAPAPTCGNGFVDTAAGEECDDGNNIDGDGCSADCLLEPGCGDGVLDAGEECDDGNNVDGDGCSADCKIEPACGDGVLDAGEECDDGNNDDGDGCSADCKIEYGGEGCTPGYWKNHLDSWGPSGLSPADDFDTTFGVDYFDPDITLGEAIRAKGGGINKIARHGTAALLNALHPDVAYPTMLSDVIAAVQAGDVDGLVNDNELSDECPAN